MELGLNLSFAIKRWVEPEQLAKMVVEDLATKRVQFTLDLVDPWWPEEPRNKIARSYKDAFEKYSVNFDAVFAGLGAYAYPQLLAPIAEQRKIAVEFFKRAIDTTCELGSKVVGSPLGSMSFSDARSDEKRAFIYQETLKNLTEISKYAKEKGIEQILIECTPLNTEFPSTPEEANQFIEDINKSSLVPVKLLIDWGHALFKPLYGENASMIEWLEKCKENIASIHLQQTDGLWDRHWDFTSDGIVTEGEIKRSMNIEGLEDTVQYLEVVPAYEDFDENVYNVIKKSMEYLKGIFSE